MNKEKCVIAPLTLLVTTALLSNSAVAEAENQSQFSEHSVMIVTAPVDSPLTISTSPKTPRQPVPASDGSDYLKTIPASRKFVMAARMVTPFFVACLALAYGF